MIWAMRTHEDVIALIYQNDQLKTIALWGQLFDIR